jgi:hypothetical protein
MNRINTPWAALLMMIFSSYSLNLEARILSVQGTNSPSQIAVTSSARSQVSWAVVEEPNAVGQAQISSSEGVFFGPSRENMLGRSSQMLTQTRSLIGDMNTTFIFQESLMIPQSVIRNAQELGFNQILYFRTFQDNPGGTSLANFVTFSLSASGAVSQVNLRQIQMEFDDGRTSAIIAANSKLSARALLSYQGSGLLEYRWEIASPPTTNGQPVFVPQMTRRDYLMANGQTTIKSPTLPTINAGTYLLRLNILQANNRFEMPILRYFVRSDKTLSDNVVVQKMTVSTPAAEVKLTLDTQFVWQPIPGAKAYQIELYNNPIKDQLASNANSAKPITGVIVPSPQTRLTMGQIVTTHLVIGSTYYWRVIAISEEGNKIGASEFRSINY